MAEGLHRRSAALGIHRILHFLHYCSNFQERFSDFEKITALDLFSSLGLFNCTQFLPIGGGLCMARFYAFCSRRAGRDNKGAHRKQSRRRCQPGGIPPFSRPTNYPSESLEVTTCFRKFTFTINVVQDRSIDHVTSPEHNGLVSPKTCEGITGN